MPEDVPSRGENGPLLSVDPGMAKSRSARPESCCAPPRHQLPRAGPGRRGQRVARVSEIVEVQLICHARGLPGLDPVVPEVTLPQLPALRPDEDVPVAARSGEVLKDVRDRVEQFGRAGDGAHPGRGLRCLVSRPSSSATAISGFRLVVVVRRILPLQSLQHARCRGHGSLRPPALRVRSGDLRSLRPDQ